ncbi:MAG TPA: glycosyltransferase, partial [Myxococcaceae bacterium]|nr:glycosyltransferase [Myxococcaceae bacterium]
PAGLRGEDIPLGSRIVAVTDAFVDELAARGVPREKMRVVKNGVDLELFRPLHRDDDLRGELGLTANDFMCLYVGTHGMAHGLQTILEAADRLREHPEIRFVLVGEGADKDALKRQAQSMGLQSVLFIDKQSRVRIPKFLAASDLSLVLLKGKPLFRTVLPSKIFEILGCARPLVLGVDGEARKVVEDAGAGLFVPPEDSAALAEAILRLRANPALCAQMGSNGRAFVKANFSRKALAEQYVDILHEIALAEA